MKMTTFRTPTEERFAFKFGNQKINVHEWGKEFAPRAHVAAPGTIDLCFIASTSLENVVKRLEDNKIQILEGPVAKTWHHRAHPFGLRARPGPQSGRDMSTRLTASSPISGPSRRRVEDVR